VAELHLHGAPHLPAEVLRLGEERGARRARPGEFSYRAFLNGKLSLLEAEALDALTRCQTTVQADRTVNRGLNSGLASTLDALSERLSVLQARAEASLDFPEDVQETPPKSLRDGLLLLRDRLDAFCADFDRSRPLRRGWRLTLAGRTNAGKSSLFNALLRRERALVSAEPGTTRDVLSETISFMNMPLTLSDSAGGGAGDEPLDELAMRAARQAARESDGVLYLYDASTGWEPADEAAAASLSHTLVAIVANKRDLCPRIPPFREENAPHLFLSALTGEGIDTLEETLAAWMRSSLPLESEPLFNERHRRCARAARNALDRSIEALEEGLSEEVALQGMRRAGASLDELQGGGDPESLYDRIFSSFCVGK